MSPGLLVDGGRLLGTLECTARTAVDVTAVWTLRDAGPVLERTARLEPGQTVTADLGLPDTADASQAITLIWVEYWDETHVGHWQDSWEPGTEPHGRGTLRQTGSRLVD
jgi:hypothetical protein